MSANSIDSNSVLIAGPMLLGVVFTPGSLVVTQGQKYSPDVPVTAESPTSWKMVVSANRSGSAPVANGFITSCRGTVSNVYSPRSAGNQLGLSGPEDLNFYFEANFSINVNGTATTTGPLFLGQGNSEFRNNWWIGGSAVYSQFIPPKYPNFGSVFAILTVAGWQLSLSGGVSDFELKVNSSAGQQQA